MSALRILKPVCLALCVGVLAVSQRGAALAAEYAIVDTGQVRCYDASREIAYPRRGARWFGQDAQYQGHAASYRDNGDGTVTDGVTGLMWSKAVAKKKVSLVEAKGVAKRMTLAGHRDWRVPTIKELYSLMDFKGYTGFSGSRDMTKVPKNAVPFINTKVFDFRYGDTTSGERYIDAQWLTSTVYVSTTMGGSKTLFGVNFADGRIKGYGYSRRRRGRGEKKFYARYVRGMRYGVNDFVDNDDGTITDRATGLTWMKADSGKAMTWREALSYAESLEHAGHSDWRLPNAKELHSIVDYSRSPDTTRSPSIDPIFKTTAITNEAKQRDFPYFWTSTTHCEGPQPGRQGAYIAFGRALGKMRGRIMDVHGAGAQRSDPKSGSTEWRGPQGDRVRVKNFVRCVRGGKATPRTTGPAIRTTTRTTRGQRPQEGADGGPGRPSFVKRLDRNGDGKVSRSEFDGPKNHFSVLDRNRDGYLSEDEAPKHPPPGRGGRR